MEIAGHDIDLSDKRTQFAIGGVAIGVVYLFSRSKGATDTPAGTDAPTVQPANSPSVADVYGNGINSNGGALGNSDNGFPANPSPPTTTPPVTTPPKTTPPTAPDLSKKISGSDFYPIAPIPTGGQKSVSYIVTNAAGAARLQSANAGARRVGANVPKGATVNLIETFTAQDNRQYGVSSNGTRYLLSDLALNAPVTTATNKAGDVTIKTPLTVPFGSASVTQGTPRLTTTPARKTLSGINGEGGNNFDGSVPLAQAVTWPNRGQVKKGLFPAFGNSGDGSPQPYGGVGAVPPFPAPFNAAGNVTVKPGQSLRDISKSAYGSASFWRRIANLNSLDQAPQAGSRIRV